MSGLRWKKGAQPSTATNGPIKTGRHEKAYGVTRRYQADRKLIGTRSG
ncbi:hypothetical protein L686_22135 [Stutzerimonas stutzeri MF28]|nr:hypothetical protein L686_22135 [Stutzerimonas stutzeri MF28]